MNARSYPEIRMLIGGKWLTSPGAPIASPADDSVLGTVPHVTSQQLEDAVAAAEVGLKTWRKTAPSKRSEVLVKAADLLRQRIDSIATVVTLESGKPLADSKHEVNRAASILEWDAQEARRLYGRIIPAEPGMRHLVLREPIGVVAAFSPWNAPIGSPVRKVAGALAAGCSIILKAAEETPGSAMLLAQALVDAGLPPGVLNLIYGNPEQISGYLIPHPSIRLVALTGSVGVGKRLAAMAGAHMKPCIMELGGHSPVIVCEDVDPVAVAKAAVPAKFRNSGQLCVGVTRFYVHTSLYDEFGRTIASEAAKLRVGPGLDPSTQMGPVANRRRVEALEHLIADALACGARLLSGGSRIGEQGCFLQPTVLGDVPDHALAMREEPFGPLVLLQRVGTLDEAIEKANSTMLGLNAYVFTNSSAVIDRCIAEIDTGYLSINYFGSSVAETPFGGVKDSGYGREGGVEGLEQYTVTKTVSMRSASPGHS